MCYLFTIHKKTNLSEQNILCSKTRKRIFPNTMTQVFKHDTYIMCFVFSLRRKRLSRAFHILSLRIPLKNNIIYGKRV